MSLTGSLPQVTLYAIAIGFAQCRLQRQSETVPYNQQKPMHVEAIRIQADAILVSPTVIYRPGQIVIREGRIVACSADCSEPADVQLPGCMLSAGLVNAHTHLEFSDLSEPFAAGQNFPEWIGSVIRHRRKIVESNSSEECLRLRRAALRTGFEESHRGWGCADRRHRHSTLGAW